MTPTFDATTTDAPERASRAPRAASAGARKGHTRAHGPGAPPPLEVSLLDKAVSAALWGAGATFLANTMGAMIALQTVLPSDRIDWLSRFYCRGQVLLTGSRWRAHVDPRVDPARPYVFCQNHTNHLDHVVFYNATPHFKQGLELERHFRYPFYGWFMRQRGTIPVRHGDRRALVELRDAFKRELERGHSVLTFPEGTRSRTGRVGPFQLGVFSIARDLGVPVVPVSVTGMFDVMRADSWIIRPGKEVTVWVDAPIETKDVPRAEVRALADRCRAVVAGRVDAWWDAKGAPA